MVVVAGVKLPDWFREYEYYAMLLAYSNSAINPLIYTCFSASFRKGWIL